MYIHTEIKFATRCRQLHWPIAPPPVATVRFQPFGYYSDTVENVLALVRGAVIHLLCPFINPHPLVIGPALLHLLRALPEPPYQLEGCARPRDTPLVGAPSSSSPFIWHVSTQHRLQDHRDGRG